MLTPGAIIEENYNYIYSFYCYLNICKKALLSEVVLAETVILSTELCGRATDEGGRICGWSGRSS